MSPPMELVREPAWSLLAMQLLNLCEEAQHDVANLKRYGRGVEATRRLDRWRQDLKDACKNAFEHVERENAQLRRLAAEAVNSQVRPPAVVLQEAAHPAEE